MLEFLTKTAEQLVHEFLADEPTRRQLYVWSDEMAEIPAKKVVRITIEYVSEAKLKNVPE